MNRLKSMAGRGYIPAILTWLLWACAPALANIDYYWYGSDDSGDWDYVVDVPDFFGDDYYGNWKWHAPNGIHEGELVHLPDFQSLPTAYDYVHIEDIGSGHSTIYLGAPRRDIASLTIDTPDYFNISGGSLWIHQNGITQNSSPESSANHLISSDVILTNFNNLPYQTIDLEEPESFLHISGVLSVMSPLYKTGAGELVLSNPSDQIDGKISIRQGSVRIAPLQPDTYVIGSDIALQSDTTLEIDNDVTSYGNISDQYGDIDVQAGRTFHVQGGLNVSRSEGHIIGGGTVRVDGAVTGSPLASGTTSTSLLTLDNSTLELGGSAPTTKIITRGDATIRAMDDDVSIYHVVRPAAETTSQTTIDTNGHDTSITWIGDGNGMTKTGAGTLTTHTVRLDELRLLGGVFHPVKADIYPFFDVDRVVLNGGELDFTGVYNHTETAQLDVGLSGGALRVDTPTGTTWAGDFDNDFDDGTLTKTGSAALILTNGGRFYGDLNVAEGKLVLNRPTWMRGSHMYVQNGAELEVAAADQFVEGTDVTLNGGTLRLDASTFRLSDVTLRGGTVAGAGTFEVSELGSVTAPADSGQSVINAPVRLVSPYGYVDTNEVTFSVGPGASLLVNAAVSGEHTRLSKTGGGTLTLANDVSGTPALDMTDSGTLRLEGENRFTGAHMDGGTIVLANPLAMRTSLGAFDFVHGTVRLDADNVNLPRMNLTAAGSTTIDLNGHTAYVGGGKIAGPGRLTVTGAGELSFAGSPYANTNDGFNVGNGAVLGIDNVNQLGAAPSTFDADQLRLNGGTLHARSNITVGARQGIFLGAFNGSLGVDAGRTLTIHSVISGPTIGSAGSLTVEGQGAVVLTAANTYRGGTTVTGGKLVVANVTGSGTGLGDVGVTDAALQVNDGGAITGKVSVSNASLVNNGTIGGGVLATDATLRGHGQINGQLYSFHSTISPGSRVGVISVHGGLNLTGGGELLIDLDPRNVQGNGVADLIDVRGTINLNTITAYPAVKLVLNLLSAPTLGQQFTIIENDGTDAISNAALDDDEPIFNRYFYADFDGQTYRFAIDYRGGPAGPSGYGNDVVLTTLHAVPEPTSLALMTVGVVALVGRKRRDREA